LRLDHKIQSRIKLTKVPFVAYDRVQIEAIVMSHLVAAFSSMFDTPQAAEALRAASAAASEAASAATAATAATAAPSATPAAVTVGAPAELPLHQPQSQQQQQTQTHVHRLLSSLFEPGALELCARKISASSADVRSALSVCRLALQTAHADADAGTVDSQAGGGGGSSGGGGGLAALRSTEDLLRAAGLLPAAPGEAEQDTSGSSGGAAAASAGGRRVVVGRGQDGRRVSKARVTMRHITAAVDELCSSSLVAFVTALPLYPLVVLTAVLALAKQEALLSYTQPAVLGELSALFADANFSAHAAVSYSDGRPQSFAAVARKAAAMCVSKGLPTVPAPAEVIAVTRRLAAAGVVEIERGYALERGFVRVSPRVNVDDVVYALKGHPVLASFLEDPQ
jgi:hypothetical protein